MKNLTITVQEDVARWARVHAAKHGTSVSRIVGEMLRERMQRDEAYEQAMRDFLATTPQMLRGPGDPLPTRDQLHDR